MKMYEKTFIISLLSGLLAGSHLSAQSKVGTSAASFLGIAVSPRATAMGNAFTGVADDATAIYYNPGGISRIGAVNTQFCYTDWILDSRLTWVGFVYNVDGANAIGLSLTHLGYGEDEDVTTVLQPEGTGERWNASDLSISFTYARNLSDRFSIGGSVKYLQSRIWNESASSFALDVGLLFTTDFNEMKLGMSISNFGGDMKFEGKDLLHRIDIDPEALGNNEAIVANLKTDAWPLPLFFRVGVSMHVWEEGHSRLTLAVDALRPSDNVEMINLGAELMLMDVLALRGGYQSLFEADAEEGLTAGIGLKMKMMTGLSWKMDYTFADYGILETYVHMFSIGLGF